jgi:general secretion pathway protein E
MESSVAIKQMLTTQSQLDPKDRPLLEMQEWCQRHGDIIVLQSGLILTSDLHSRNVQNCKITLKQRGLPMGKVVQATQELIDLLLADAQAAVLMIASQVSAHVSLQQQRLRTLVKDALNLQVSDIHIEVRQELARIRFRKHGELYLHAEWQPVLGREIASVAFNKETDHAISHFNPTVPQNASMPLTIDGTPVRLRLASMPAHGGFDMVMRVLTTGDEKTHRLAELGYQADQIAMIERAVAMPHGAVIVSGPTGSGKTTTLASCMTMVDDYRKIYTIEDPVEKIILNATQIPVNIEKEDRDFASMGKAALRMDPDVIVLGEMRDEETAKVMLRAAISGHLVFSTLHTNTATAIVTRLADMGISPLLLSDPNLLVCLICQRLVPVLCEACAVPMAKSVSHQGLYEIWHKTFGNKADHIRLRNPHQQKCSTCHGLGITNRTVVAELIWIDDAGRHFIQQRDTLGWEKHLRDNGWQSYHDRAIALVLSGVADPIDVERLTGIMANILIGSKQIYPEKGSDI